MKITQETGTKLANGEFVAIAGMHYNVPLIIKKPFMTLFNCYNNDKGKKESNVYLVELILFVI